MKPDGSNSSGNVENNYHMPMNKKFIIEI